MRNVFALVAVFSLCITGCAAHTFAKPDRVAAQHAHSKRNYVLARSLYVSQLYDDNERWLLSERPSHEVSHRVSFLGHPIHPPTEMGIVPAGTPVTLERIEFPTRTVVTHRMLNSPVHHIWLRVRPTADAHLPVSHDRPCVIVLGLDVQTPTALNDAIATHLEDSTSLHAWLDNLSPTVRVGIETKQAVRGMDARALVAALGEPREWRRLGMINGHDTTIARYKAVEVWLMNDVVSEVRTSSGSLSPRE